MRRPAGDASESGDFRDWSPERAEVLARRAGMAPLSDHHWKVITSFREEAARTGRPPGLRRLVVLTGLGAVELGSLFPGDTGTLVARLAGLARRRSRARARTDGGSVEG